MNDTSCWFTVNTHVFLHVLTDSLSFECRDFLLLQTQHKIKNVYVIHRRGREQKRKEQEVEADAAVPTHKFVRGASTNHRWANADLSPVPLSLRAAPLSHLTWTSLCRVSLRPLKHMVSMAPFEYPLSHHQTAGSLNSTWSDLDKKTSN